MILIFVNLISAGVISSYENYAPKSYYARAIHASCYCKGGMWIAVIRSWFVRSRLVIWI